MSKEFIIVIEADNKRAAASYRKGLEDLDLVMPQLMQVAQARDAVSQAEYEAKMQKWHESAPVLELDDSWLPGANQRARERYFRENSSHIIRMPRKSRWTSVGVLESVRDELKRMLDIAETAMGPYRMTEHQVEEMIRWENGRRVEGLKRDAGL